MQCEKQCEDRFVEMREEIIQLLRAQLEALANLSGLTDDQLTACYTRQERVRELRNQLTHDADLSPEDAALTGQSPNAPPANPEAAVASF
jgi:hypothetical protein